jgi:integrase
MTRHAVSVAPVVPMKNGREHRVPLSDRAVNILEHIQALRGSFVSPAVKPDKPLSNMSFLKAARRVTTTPLKHGFRSSFWDWCEERTNVTRTVSEAALAHVVADKTEAAYRRTDLRDKRRDLMDLWAHFVTAAPADVASVREFVKQRR